MVGTVQCDTYICLVEYAVPRATSTAHDAGTTYINASEIIMYCFDAKFPGSIESTTRLFEVEQAGIASVDATSHPVAEPTLPSHISSATNPPQVLRNIDISDCPLVSSFGQSP